MGILVQAGREELRIHDLGVLIIRLLCQKLVYIFRGDAEQALGTGPAVGFVLGKPLRPIDQDLLVGGSARRGGGLGLGLSGQYGRKGFLDLGYPLFGGLDVGMGDSLGIGLLDLLHQLDGHVQVVPIGGAVLDTRLGAFQVGLDLSQAAYDPPPGSLDCAARGPIEARMRARDTHRMQNEHLAGC